MYKDGGDPSDIMRDSGLEQLDDTAELEKIAAKIIAANPDQAAQYKNGKTNVIQFLVGKLMAETGGKANPKIARDILEKALNK